MVFKKIDEERRLQKVRSQCTRDCEKSTRSSWSGRCLTIYSNIQSALCTDCIMPHTETTEIIGTYNQSNLMARMRHIPLNGHIWFIILFVSRFWSSSKCPKSTRLNKVFLSTWKYSLSEENSVEAGEILLDISYWTILPTTQCDLQCSLIIYLPIQARTCWIHFFWLL